MWSIDLELVADYSYVVARIAYRSSDLVLTVQPTLQTDSIFSKSLSNLSVNRVKGVVSESVPEVRLPPPYQASFRVRSQRESKAGKLTQSCRSVLYAKTKTLYSPLSILCKLAPVSPSLPLPPSSSLPYRISTGLRSTLS